MRKAMMNEMFVPLLLATLLFTPVPAWADFDVTIGGSASSGGAWSGGTPEVWTPDATGATVSVAEIQARLASGNVAITTAAGSGNGDIIITAPLVWSGNTLTLSAGRDVQINAVLTAGNTAALTMYTAQSVATGKVRTGFASGGGFAGRVDFFQADGTTPRSGTGFLAINGSGYAVITSLGTEGSTTADLQGISAGLAGKYALGANIDASVTSGWNSDAGFAPLGNGTTNFTGVFDGLGHTISRLNVRKISTGGSNYAGLFGYAGSGAVLGNVGLANALIYGSNSNNLSNVINYSGALVGHNYGSISNSWSSGNVYGSSSTGATATNYSGGLVGDNHGNISSSWSSDSIYGSVSTSSGGVNSNYSGGFVGANSGGSIDSSYSIGSVNGLGNAVGIVKNNYSGGLVGTNDSGSISNSWSTGSVFVISNYFDNCFGGLVGYNSGSISNSYSTGLAYGSGSYNYSGGLVGCDNSGSVSNSFWDTESSGLATSSGGSGKTTAEMKTLATFANAGWDIVDITNSTSVWRIIDTKTYPTLRVFSPQLNIPTSSIVLDPATPATLYAGLDGAGIYKSTDGGQSWSPANPQPGNKNVKTVVIKPGAGNGNTLYAATYGGGVFTSSNGGEGWAVCSDGATANSGLTNLNVVSLTIATNTTLYAGTEAGVFVSSDGCATWSAMNNGLPN